MWHLELEPEQVVKMFLGTTLLPNAMRSQIVKGSPPSTGLRGSLLVWIVDPRETFSPPTIVVVREGTKNSLLPKLMSIPGNLSPITSYTRIWSEDEFRIFQRRSTPKLNEFLLAGLVGLTVSELVVRLGSEVELSTMGTSAAQRTFAYSLARLFCSGGAEREYFDLAAGWKTVSELTANPVDDMYVDLLVNFGRFLRKVESASIFTGLSEELALFIQSELPRNVSIDLFGVSAELKIASRERRVAQVEFWISRLREGTLEGANPTINLACGFLISQIAPGSLDFMELALNVDRKKGYVAAAYGLCAGLLGGTPFLWKGDGFGFTLVSRGLQRTNDLLATQPDISMAELIILQERISESGFEFRTRHPSIVEVEIAPDVTGAFVNGLRRVNKPTISESLAHQRELPQRDLLGGIVFENTIRIKHLLNVLEKAVADLDLPPDRISDSYGVRKKSKSRKY